MKVKCINSGIYNNISVNSIYEVINESDGYYIIKNDINKTFFYLSHLFKEIEDSSNFKITREDMNDNILKMRTLQIEDDKARRIYKTASPELKVMLEDVFGKEFFFQKVTERIKTYEDACAELGITPIDERTLLNNGFTKDEIAYRKIKTITKALNEGWEPDWNDEGQKKWIPSFYPNSSSGFVFYDAYCSYSHADAGNGLRLCFKTRALAEYAGKQFIEIWNKILLK